MHFMIISSNYDSLLFHDGNTIFSLKTHTKTDMITPPRFGVRKIQMSQNAISNWNNGDFVFLKIEKLERS